MVDWTGFPRARFPFDWVCDWGEDDQGVWCAFTIEGVRQALRWCPPGRFLMGSPKGEPERYDDEAQHPVTLTRGFWLADTACTQGLWKVVVGTEPSRFVGEERPVEQVSWDDVQVFLEKLRGLLGEDGFRLPTEAEWEYACRAGMTTPFWFGDQINPDQVNYRGDRPYNQGEKGTNRGETVAVTALPANGWGLYQMHGNVWEWCEDTWREDLGTEAVVDPVTVGGTARVIRGGGWNDFGTFARSAFRYRYDPGARGFGLGFRFALVEKRSLREQEQEAKGRSAGAERRPTDPEAETGLAT